MEVTETLLRQVRLCGEMNFSLDDIISVFDEPLPENFEFQFEDPESLIYKTYQQGKATTEENLSKSQLRLAVEGESEAVSAIELVKRNLKLDTMKRKLFGV